MCEACLTAFEELPSHCRVKPWTSELKCCPEGTAMLKGLRSHPHSINCFMTPWVPFKEMGPIAAVPTIYHVYSLGATSFSSRATVPRSFLAIQRTASVSSTFWKVTRLSTMFFWSRWVSMMISEILFVRKVHEVSLLHLKRSIDINEDCQTLPFYWELLNEQTTLYT